MDGERPEDKALALNINITLSLSDEMAFASIAITSFFDYLGSDVSSRRIAWLMMKGQFNDKGAAFP